ncbi:hypothetical protein SSUR61_0966 [Streptococcus suis R61]|uniref:Uncharacterized protein n=1 Tax=Streptococcus suis R61 TaxID=996306 RepID=A0AA87K530_STRSU|nr:hypothetical protein [Streptococcus suis]EHC03063.1 hypothetical protein SSUR61_0966 [Streptococcus suis R61]
MYEFVLEYGSFPVKLIDGFVNNRSEIPDFLKEDEEMITRLNEINELFHQLFLTSKCSLTTSANNSLTRLNNYEHSIIP